MKRMRRVRKKFHLVSLSPWPFSISLTALNLVISTIAYIHLFVHMKILLVWSVTNLLLVLTIWWTNVILEASYERLYTGYIRKNLRLGFILFIISEIVFFLVFFWSYFHSSVISVQDLGYFWPPLSIEVFNAFDVPFLNTWLLLLSGASITYVHYILLVEASRYEVQQLVSFFPLWVDSYLVKFEIFWDDYVLNNKFYREILEKHTYRGPPSYVFSSR